MMNFAIKSINDEDYENELKALNRHERRLASVPPTPKDIVLK
jgi:hypothetical protein